MRKNARNMLGAAVALASLTFAGAAIAQQGAAAGQVRAAAQAKQSQARAPKVMVIAFHADWCAGCRVLGPKMMDDVLPSVKGEPLLLVKLDQTDRDSAQAEFMLAALGLGDLWAEYGGKTGFALVVDMETKKVVANLGYKQDPGAMQKSLKAALKS